MTSVPLPGDRLLQVDGVNLCGLTHKQAVQCLKGSGQVSAPLLVTGELSFPPEFSSTTSEAVVASGWEGVGRKPTRLSVVSVFLLSHLPFTSAFLWRCESQQEASRCSQAVKLTSSKEP